MVSFANPKLVAVSNIIAREIYIDTVPKPNPNQTIHPPAYTVYARLLEIESE